MDLLILIFPYLREEIHEPKILAPHIVNACCLWKRMEIDCFAGVVQMEC